VSSLCYFHVMAVVNIPDPCSRKPESMVPVSGGYYCDDCCKVVIDFREKSNEEILSELRNRESQRICGFFTKAQASRGGKVTFELARFAAAILLVFGSILFVTSTSGCGGMPADEPRDSVEHAAYLAQSDSILKADLIQKKIDSINATRNTATDPVQWTADSANAADSIAHEIDPAHYPR